MKGIIFTAESILGLKLGIKTQTRRLAKDDESPRYKVGETLYAKEAYALVAWDGFTWVATREGDRAIFRADGGELPDPYESNPTWKTPLFMPAWAARYHVTISEVRTQRLHAITVADAWAEGIDVLDGALDDAEIRRCAKLIRCSHEDPQPTYLAAWDTIHRGSARAERNPMVHAYTFTARSV